MNGVERQTYAKNWTRRKVLTTGSTMLLGLAACRSNTVSGSQHMLTTAHIRRVSTRPPITPTIIPDTPVTLAFTGDIMFGRTVNEHMLTTVPDDPYPFTYTADFLRQFDLTIGNLECVVSRLGTPVAKPKGFLLRGDPLAYRRLIHAGFDLVSVANNHSGDYGKGAFLDEILTLPTHGITPIGGGRNKHEANAPVFKTVRTTTLAFLAYDEIAPFYFAATATTPGHAWLNEDDLRRDVSLAQRHADFVIVFVHWGIEYSTTFNVHQRSLAQAAIDAGAHLIVGAHPHVIELYEYYKGKLIIYSLGNFVFDYMDAEVVRRGNILTLTIHNNRLLTWKLVPTHIGNWGEPKILSR